MILRTFAAAAAAALFFAAPANARDYAAGSLTISQPWSRATPAGAPTAAGFLAVADKGGGDRLLGGSTSVAAEVQVHEMSNEGGVMRMRPLAQGLAVPRGGRAELKPGGLHIMFIGLKRPLKAGERFPVTLTFQRAGAVNVEFVVVPVGQGAP